MKNYILAFLEKYVEKTQVSLISNNIIWYFTWGPIYICDNISLSSAQNENSF